MPFQFGARSRWAGRAATTGQAGWEGVPFGAVRDVWRSDQYDEAAKAAILAHLDPALFTASSFSSGGEAELNKFIDAANGEAVPPASTSAPSKAARQEHLRGFRTLLTAPACDS